MPKSDADIQRDVQSELKWNTRLSQTEIGVEVREGIVTLSGQVDSAAKRVSAQQAAHRVAGVLDVANDLVVTPPGTMTDTDIAAAVRHALEWDAFVPDRRIRSTISSGLVTLEGDVDTFSQRDDAEHAVVKLVGVKGVINRIEVRALPVVPSEVKRAIQLALERHAEREAKAIDVDVQDGNVVLTGTVHSWDEKTAVVGAARGTRGVRHIEDHIVIER